jgi:predicted DCC family thiol-disulfide oxidoreductase YuxK
VRSLTVLYDARCGLCSTARHWLEGQVQIVPLELVPAGSNEARRRFPTLAGTEPEELIVVSEEGDVYRDGHAWIVCLWALAEYRDWSFRLARPSLLPLARGAFAWVSTRRHRLSRALHLLSDQEIRAEAEAVRCGDDACTPSGEGRAR